MQACDSKIFLQATLVGIESDEPDARNRRLRSAQSDPHDACFGLEGFATSTLQTEIDRQALTTDSVPAR
jgi:hypothetical protein